jgi:formylglycine-generating enzyme required for sulfatase activity
MKSHRLSSKRSVIWRGDLIRTRLFESAYSDNRPDVLPLIDSLGFTAELPAEPLETGRLGMEKFRKDLVEFNRLKKETPSNELEQPPVTPTHNWTPTQFQSPPWKARSQDPEREDLSQTENPNGMLVERVPLRPLATWPQLRNRLQPMLSRTVVTRKVDAKKLVAMLCRCESIAKLPRVERKRSPEQVHVIADRSDRCIPFFSDQQLVAEQIGRELARDQCRFSVGRLPHVLDKSNTTLRTQFRRGWTESEEDVRNEEPDPQSTVLILGDLAVLERHKPQERASWVHCCRRWRQRGVKIYALVPYATDQLPREFAELVEPIAWQGNGVEYASDQRREDLLRAIFVRSYPAMQLEPALLRELRTMVPDAMDASLESDIWQHDWLASNHVGGARNDRVDVKERLQDEFERLEDETRRWVLSIQRRFRQSQGYRSLWQLEFLNQTLRTRELLKEYEQDTEAMRRTLKEYEAYVRSGAIPDDKHDQIAWYSRRASEAALNDKDKRIGESVRLLQRTFQDSESFHPATQIPEIRSDGIQRSVGLTGRFDKIEARVIRGGSEVASVGSDRVTMRSTSPVIEIQVPELDAVARRERDFWKSGVKPQWVSDYGTDAYGAWCEFQVPRHDGKGMVTQRMRWIKPGEFMMGSPLGEEVRFEDESPQHHVKLTQGYWMADSQVTQELWMAVGRGENPSGFKGENNPVENVSWEDCQSWFEKLCEHHESLQIGLPTEAQWEYACRAGSQSAYCFGDDPKELTKYGWFDNASSAGTRPVKQFHPNIRGLYDVHGNVWEWCSDWYGDYATSAQSDPTGPAEGTERVVRGGSFFDAAWETRSANRFSINSSYRAMNAGFRIAGSALGAEPNERAMLPVAERRKAQLKLALAKKYESLGKKYTNNSTWKKRKIKAKVTKYRRQAAMLEKGTERARIVSAEPAYEFLRSVDLDATGDRTPEQEFSELDVNAYASVRVVSDQEGYQFDRLEKPSWAVDFGSDQYGLFATFEVKPVRQRMRWIPPGKFVMGSPAGRDYGRDDEGPQHEVIITHGYWMFDTPCTQGLWTALMGKNPGYFPDPERPVEQVRWQDAVGFAKKLNERLAKDYPSIGKGLVDGWERLLFRLPTEAEWEYACRAGTRGDTYAGDLNLKSNDETKSEILDSIAWYGGNSGHKYDLEKSEKMTWMVDLQAAEKEGGSRKVAQKTPNPWGLYDMLGNVWEWCQDWHGLYPAERLVDPTGPAEGTACVMRGGSWNFPTWSLRSACRLRSVPGDRLNFLGFRLLSSAHQATESGEQV